MPENSIEKKDIPQEVLEIYIDQAKPPSYQQFRKDQYFIPEIQTVFRNLWKVDIKKIQKDQLGDVNIAVENRKKDCYEKAAKVIYEKYKNKPHPVEVRELKKFLSVVGRKYNLEDPEVVYSLHSIISHFLETVRMQYYVNNGGLTQTIYSEHGSHEVPSALLKTKLDYHRAFMEALKTMNNMIHGEKHKLDVNVNTLDINDMIRETRGEKVFDYYAEEVEE